MTIVGTREPLRHVLCCHINDTEILTKEDTLILGCMKFHKHDLNNMVLSFIILFILILTLVSKWMKNSTTLESDGKTRI
jgi:hypothetical protein